MAPAIDDWGQLIGRGLSPEAEGLNHIAALK
jgi:hypothetical protein